MSFQPFGYRFEVRSPRPPAEVKAAINSRKKSLFEVKDGARGWMAGPFLCLWFSAFDRYGPMLFGIVSSDGAGTRVHGRAGSDLNGVAAFSLVLLLMAFLTYQSIAEGTTGDVAVMALFLVVAPLIYWVAHKDRKSAEPLVRFLRDSLSPSGRALGGKSAAMTISQGLALSIDGETLAGPVKPESIHDAMAGVGEGSFVILESGPETYMQALSHNGGYIVEKREGNSLKHFRAARAAGDPAVAERSNYVFDFDEARDIFMAYASAAPMPKPLLWERLDLKG